MLERVFQRFLQTNLQDKILGNIITYKVCKFQVFFYDFRFRIKNCVNLFKCTMVVLGLMITSSCSRFDLNFYFRTVIAPMISSPERFSNQNNICEMYQEFENEIRQKKLAIQG